MIIGVQYVLTARCSRGYSSITSVSPVARPLQAGGLRLYRAASSKRRLPLPKSSDEILAAGSKGRCARTAAKLFWGL